MLSSWENTQAFYWSRAKKGVAQTDQTDDIFTVCTEALVSGLVEAENDSDDARSTHLHLFYAASR